jgi:N-acetylneuraminate synthase
MDSVVNPVKIGERWIGPGHPCFIIAEAGVNHNGDPSLARELVEAAASAGADAVKFQTFKAERLVTADAPKADYQKKTTDAREPQIEMLRRLELSEEAYHHLQILCNERDILFFSTPFDEESADFLEKIGVPAFKISSGEITNLPFLAHIARKGKPMILSTGMSRLEEVADALRAVKETGNKKLVLLHCVSNYPADPADVNLRAMETMEKAFRKPVGFSDHTMGIEVALAAVALGARIIEKHFTLDRSLPGPDHPASLEPGELAAMIKGIRSVESALGHGRKEPTSGEIQTARVARKSLVSALPIRAGSCLTEEMIAIKRPGTGLPPSMRGRLIGKIAIKDIPADTLLNLDMVS